MTNRLHLDRRKAVALVTLGALVAAAVALLLGSNSSGASSTTDPASALSVLKPATTSARDALPENAQNWLVELEGPTLANSAATSLSGLGTVQTAAGQVVVADYGTNVCIYITQQSFGTCGGINLVRGTGLYVVAPGGCGPSTVVGILPDGYKSVRATSGNDTADQKVPVSSNIYVAEVGAGETVLTAATDSGESFRTVIPLGRTGSAPAGSAGC